MRDLDPRSLDRREYLKMGLAAAATVGLAGCSEGELPSGGGDGSGAGDGPTATGYLATEVTDQPTDIDDFESCVVTIEGVWLGPRHDLGGGEEGDDEGEDEETGDEGGAEEDGDEETTEEETTEEETTTDGDDGGNATSQSLISGSQPEDAGPGGNETEPDDGEEDEEEADDDGEEDEKGADDEGEEDDGEGGDEDGNGRQYLEFDEPQQADLVELQGDNTQLIDERELTVGTYQYLQLNVSNVDGVLNDGSEATVETAGQAGLKFQEPFDVREGHRTTFTADFAPVRRGNGSYLIQPVAKGTEVRYEPVDGSGSVSGDSDGGEETDGTTDGGDETDDGGDTTDGDGGNTTDTDGGNTTDTDGGNTTATGD